ncbi:hypothetical protein POM88_029115 [Heracleum sosnowskyi]|uniref:Uncharacterized protein n=1 Tax=Heracleum sosnowskyi TaxID=360622 RepID=A0AAD8HT17_9APIA|nr:hypothetical protein POM88_029115 [Heracleum sosnowskyi]
MDLVIKFASLLWGIWFFRNKLVWENKVVTAKVVTDWSSKMVVDWQLAKMKIKRPGEGACNTTCGAQTFKWKPPTAGEFKLNVDASVPKNEHYYSIGMVLCDNTGKFVQGG